MKATRGAERRARRGTRLAVTVGTDDVRVPLALERVQRLARGVLRAEGVRTARVSIAFVSDRTMARLNRMHLGHRGATDVLAFGFAAPTRATGLMGDVYIAPAVARHNASEWGVGVREELARLVVHGVLHVIGHDHPTDDGRTDSPMWRRQEGLIRRLVGSHR